MLQLRKVAIIRQKEREKMQLVVDVDLLRKTISEKGLRMEDVANYLNMNRSTFFRKLKNNGEGFTIKDIHEMVEKIPLSIEEVKSIFFKNKVT